MAFQNSLFWLVDKRSVKTHIRTVVRIFRIWTGVPDVAFIWREISLYKQKRVLLFHFPIHRYDAIYMRLNSWTIKYNYTQSNYIYIYIIPCIYMYLYVFGSEGLSLLVWNVTNYLGHLWLRQHAQLIASDYEVSHFKSSTKDRLIFLNPLKIWNQQSEQTL